MNGRLGKYKFSSFMILIDSKPKSSIIIGKHMQKLQKKKPIW